MARMLVIAQNKALQMREVVSCIGAAFTGLPDAPEGAMMIDFMGFVRGTKNVYDTFGLFADGIMRKLRERSTHENSWKRSSTSGSMDEVSAFPKMRITSSNFSAARGQMRYLHQLQTRVNFAHGRFSH